MEGRKKKSEERKKKRKEGGKEVRRLKERTHNPLSKWTYQILPAFVGAGRDGVGGGRSYCIL